MAWWHEARFGMFVHWGLYAQLGRHEWVMNRERIPLAEYERLADTWRPKERPAREWAKLAVDAGMTVEALARSIHAHPTLSETLMESAQAVLGVATHMASARRAR